MINKFLVNDCALSQSDLLLTRHISKQKDTNGKNARLKASKWEIHRWRPGATSIFYTVEGCNQPSPGTNAP